MPTLLSLSECLHNISVPDPLMRGYVVKDDMFVPKWLSKFLPLMLQNFFKHANAKQQSVWHVSMQHRLYHLSIYLSGINFCNMKSLNYRYRLYIYKTLYWLPTIYAKNIKIPTILYVFFLLANFLLYFFTVSFNMWTEIYRIY